MTTIINDDEWFELARKAVQETVREPGINSPLVLMPSVEIQPSVDLVPWRVMRLTCDAIEYDVLVGYDIATGYGRASTPVQAFDAARAEVTTRSGRIYRLVEAPGYDSDGEYVFRSWLGRFLTDSNHCDVSSEYWDAMRAAEPAPTSGPNGNDTSAS